MLLATLLFMGTGLTYGLFHGWLGSRYARPSQMVRSHVKTRMGAVERGVRGARPVAQVELVSFGAPATPCVLPYLQAPQAETREVALTILARTGDWSIVGDIEGMLTDPTPEVRHHAVRALYTMSADQALPRIRACSTDSDYSVRAAVAMTLGDFRDNDNVAVLTQLSRDENSAVRHQAVVSLGRLGEVEAVPVLAERLADPWARTQLAAMHSLHDLTGLPAHPDSHLWVLWYAAHHAVDTHG